MENPFESGRRKLIPAVLVYAEREGQILMVSRDGSALDFHLGKWNGLGGKLELGESMLGAARREFREECGLELETERFKPLGTLQFPNFKPHKNEDWLVFVLTVSLRTGETPWASGPEGTLSFIDKDQLLGLNLWEGDRHFLPHVLARRPFMGTFWYEQKALVCYELTTLP